MKPNSMYEIHCSMEINSFAVFTLKLSKAGMSNTQHAGHMQPFASTPAPPHKRHCTHVQPP